MYCQLLITFTCLIGSHLLFSSATSIQHISVEQTESHYAVSGIIKHDGGGHICYKGSKKKWGKREAVTACKQLGYLGGWPWHTHKANITTNNLNNFDCDQNLSDLENCEYEVTELCEDSLVAAITCYNSFQVILVDGKTPNIGRVGVKYDEISSDVCYTREGSSPWDFDNTQVVCRELGYPGAMFYRDDNVCYEKLQHKNTMCGYECNDDFREHSLQNCLPDLPYHSNRFATSNECSGVIIACAIPGYIGCFDDTEVTEVTENLDGTIENESSFKSINMTINMCRRHCREKIYRYAFLSKGNKCSCTSVKPENPVGDTHCHMKCSGDNNEVCGYDDALSGYDVTTGICDDPLDTMTVYFFGDTFTIKCKPGTEPVNQASIQCVWDNAFKRVTWNSTEHPKCKANDIQNLTITEETKSPYAVSGTIAVKFDDKDGYICYYGSKENWGNHEAATACRHLGYTGGWPTMTDAPEMPIYNLNNFNCNGSLESLNSCKYDATTYCKSCKIAGVECYNSFRINLVDRKAPNIGRIQVKYDDIVSDVCHTQEGSNPWVFDNTQVACRELGYPGVMYDSQTSNDYKMKSSTISGYNCTNDLEIKSIQMCNPNFLHQSTFVRADKSKENEDCSGVIIACALPGYIGCRSMSNQYDIHVEIHLMTINLCRRNCRSRDYRYAFLVGGDICYCAESIIGNLVGDSQCTMRCSGDNNEVCGDQRTASAYDVTKGKCEFTQENSIQDSFFFGEFFECKQQIQFNNHKPIQCVLDDLTRTVGWNSSDFFHCQDMALKDEERKNGSSGRNFWVSIPLLCIFFVIYFIGFKCRHKLCDKGRNIQNV